MNSRSQPDRSQLLRSKHEEIQGIVKSRKRKLREFWAICESTEPVPNFIFQSPDAPPINDEEQRFLELSDILKDRLFNESNLPTRRNLRSDISKRRSPIRKITPDGRSTDISRNAAKVQRDVSRPRKSRAPTPSSKSDVGHEGASKAEAPAGQELPLQRSASKGSQTDLPPESAAVLNEIIEETFESATQPRADIPNELVPPGQLERDRVEQLESRPNSPGVDPRKAMPILAEDAARLKEPLINGLGSHDGPPHKALTVHLPPKEVQERHAKESHQIKSHPSSNFPPPDGVRAPDHLSSPGSTSAHSATTPGLHEASTDTSPDHESRYNVERPEKEDRPSTPTESKNTPEALREDVEAQQLGRPDNLQSSPITAEAQLRSEGQAASQRPFTSTESEEGGAVNSSIDQTSSSCLTNNADEVVEEAVEATLEDKVGAACTPKSPKESVLDEPSISQRTNGKDEIADSEAGDTPSADAMDIDSTPVQKFSAGRASVELADRTPVSPKALPPAVLDQPKKSPTSATPTPRRESVTATPVPERMTTRVSSGAMRHKSVSEILGESPRLATVQNSERNSSDRNGHRTQSELAGLSDSHSRVTTAHSPITRKSLIQKSKDKDRSMLSTVVFAKQTLRQNDSAKLSGGNDPIKDDYFKPLFLSAAMSPARGYSALDTLLGKAHKTISTNNAYVPILENQTIKVLKRIFDLQKNDRWSLRQPKRSEEPQRPSSHWDVVLQEAKWMRTDFREERKWKMMVAKNLAFACAEWHSASPGDRKKIQINAVPPPPKDTEMTETANQEQGVPELVSSTEVNSPMDEDEEPQLDLPETVSPYAIFGLQDDDVVFGLRNSPISHRLLEELPMYCAPLCVPSTELSAGELDPERFWKRKALPISRYVEGEMRLKKGSPPRKKSRYQYEEESDDDELTTFGDIAQKRPVLPPEKNDVALFNPEHKHIRDRIHAGHQFRPPSEYPMPLQSFFENRQSSQWTLQEDDDLRRYVREYSYNWSFISNMLQTKSLFSSGPERRTPWECFERWVSLEGLPGDMQKTQYFRLYTQRVETANRNVLALASQPQQPNPNGQIQPPRRRTTSSIRVERRRNQKHLTLVDAMRKLAKKRENTIQKQQQAAGLAASRKPPELTAHRNASRTPAEFSRLKFEQQEKLKQSILLQQQQQHQQRVRRPYHQIDCWNHISYSSFPISLFMLFAS
ncbi:hypothetical protein B0O99DRAFT_58560 [Bisporella sp. PMI_857]|nr:hypothetical protein B0O99DRAFT_58560 [Bisporella sp. PMI_857]